MDYEEIWLQQRGEGDLRPRTWCKDEVHEDDTRYVRADRYEALIARYLRLLDAGVVDVDYEAMLARCEEDPSISVDPHFWVNATSNERAQYRLGWRMAMRRVKGVKGEE